LAFSRCEKKKKKKMSTSTTNALEIERIASIAVKNVTSKSGLTQPAHFVCKNAAFEVALVVAKTFSERSALDLTRATLELSLVYDSRAPPFKLVDFVAGKKVLSYQAVGVTARAASLHVRIGVLSSQVEGALFRVQIDAIVDGGVRHTVYSPPITVVSKPYLALRAEGQRGKPKPQNKRRIAAAPLEDYDDEDDDEDTDDTSHVVAPPQRTTTNANAVINDGLLTSLDLVRQEQMKHRELLEKLLQQTTTTVAAAVAPSNDDDSWTPQARVKRSRHVAPPLSSTPIDEDDADTTSTSTLSPAQFNQFGSFLNPIKQVENRADSLTAALIAVIGTERQDEAVAVLRRVLPSTIVEALGRAAATPAPVCELFLNGCPHERELNELRKRELFGSSALFL
jgi:hypothetical protein